MTKLLLLALLLLVSLNASACGGATTRNDAASSETTVASPSKSSDSEPSRESLPKIVAFGDSLTAGMGLSSAESYPALLQQRLDADGYKYEVINAGVSGDTSAGGVRRIDWSLEGGNVRVVILELGANDFLRGQPVSETKKNLSRIIERARARGADVLLAGMYIKDGAGDEYLREINEAYETIAREQKVAFIPFFLEGVAGRDALNQPDRIHPNAEGAKIVADTVYKHLRPMLDKQEEAGK